MTGTFQGAAKRFKRDCLPGFYKVWCASHKVDLLIQALMNRVMKEAFQDPLVDIILYPRRQYSLRNEMGSTCPFVSRNGWSSLGTCTVWLIWHQARNAAYLIEKIASLQPSYTWWIFLSAVKHFMQSVDICIWEIQGHCITILEQNKRLQALISDLKNMGGISGPYSGTCSCSHKKAT